MGCSTSAAVATVPFPQAQSRGTSNRASGKAKVSVTVTPSGSSDVGFNQILPGFSSPKCRAATETSRTTGDSASLDGLKDMCYGGSLETLGTLESRLGSHTSSLLEEEVHRRPSGDALPKRCPSSAPSTSTVSPSLSLTSSAQSPLSGNSRIFYPRYLSDSSASGSSKQDTTLTRDVSIVPRPSKSSAATTSPIEAFFLSPCPSSVMTPIPSGSCPELAMPRLSAGCSESDDEMSARSDAHPDRSKKASVKRTPSHLQAAGSPDEGFGYYYSACETAATELTVVSVKSSGSARSRRGSVDSSTSVTRTVTWGTSTVETLPCYEWGSKERASEDDVQNKPSPSLGPVPVPAPPSLSTKKRGTEGQKPKQARKVSFSQNGGFFKDTPEKAGVLDSMIANASTKVQPCQLQISEALLLACFKEAFSQKAK